MRTHACGAVGGGGLELRPEKVAYKNCDDKHKLLTFELYIINTKTNRK